MPGFVTKELAPTEMPATVAAPVNTYVTPSPNVSPVGQFLEGLGKLAPAVSTAVQNFNQQDGEAEEAQARIKALTADPKALRQEIDSGNYFGLAHKRARAALQVMDAQNRVFDVDAELSAMHQRGELGGADAQGRIGTLVQSHSDNLSDPLAAKTFSTGMVPVMRKYSGEVLRANVAADQENKQASLFQYMTALHDQVDRDANDSGPINADTIREMHKKALYRTADYAKNDLLMSPLAIEKVLGDVAKHYAATGNTVALDAIGNYDRGGAPLSAKYGPQWDAWSKTAEAKQDSTRKTAVNDSIDRLEAQALRADQKPEDLYKAVEIARAQDPKNFPEAKAERLKQVFTGQLAARTKAANDQLAAQQEGAYEREYIEKGAQALSSGNGYVFPSQARFTAADGKERTYSLKDYQQRMYERASGQIDEQAQKEGWTQEQTAGAKVRLYGQNGDVHPVYQGSFNDLFHASRAGVAPNPQTLPQRLGQLEFLRTTDPSQFLNLADKADKKQQTWLAAYRAGRDFGMEPERAFEVANQRVFNPTAVERLSAKDMDTRVDDVLKKLGSSSVLVGPIARQKAADAVNLQIAAGVSDADIVGKAAETINRTHIVVNGVPVHNSIPGVGNPAVATEYLQDAARYFKDSNPKLKGAPYDIAFADDTARPGSYIPIRTDTMERLSRTGVSGGEVKDYVLRWRAHKPPIEPTGEMFEQYNHGGQNP